MRRLPHAKAAGPPVIVTVASVGRSSRRYCWAGSRVPLTENVGGATAPAVIPIVMSCPEITESELRMPAAGAVTSS